MNVAYQGVQIQRDLPYVEVPQELLGQAIPPLYDGYRELLMDLTHVPLDSRKRKVTDRIRNCAARILGYLNYLAQNGSHGGIQYSRAQFQHLFRNEYGMETIELAQSLLIVSRLVLPPNQHPSTDRAFCWRLDVLRLQAAFARLAARQKSSDTHSHRHPEHHFP